MTRFFKSTAILAVFCAAPALADGIEISDAYARANGPSAKAGAAFMVITNSGAIDDRLIGAETEIARKAELHSHEIDANGVARMRQIEGGMVIPAAGSHRLTRGGDHVMMIGLNQDLVDGAVIEVPLTFENAGEMVVDVPVDSARGQAGAHKH